MATNSLDRNDEAKTLHQVLVDTLIADGHVRSAKVEAALRSVPRHLFVPGIELDRVYRNEAITTKRAHGVGVSSASQPSVVAIMLEQLQLKQGLSVLEIGAGTGYNAALMAHIVGETGQVVTIDIDEDIVQSAQEHLHALGVENVQAQCRDGALGCQDAGPYDRIVLTVGTWDIAPAWLEQLKPGGLLLVPLTLKGGVQKTIAFQRNRDHLASVSISDCSFILLRGPFAGPEKILPLGPEPGAYIRSEQAMPMERELAYRYLSASHKDLPTKVTVMEGEVWSSLNLWLAFNEAGFCALGVDGELAESDIVPRLFRWGRLCGTVGVIDEASISVLMHPPGGWPTLNEPWDLQPFELWVRRYGKDSGVAHRLVRQIKAWDVAGRPSTARLSVRAYPKDESYESSPDEIVLEKRWMDVVIRWR